MAIPIVLLNEYMSYAYTVVPVTTALRTAVVTDVMVTIKQKTLRLSVKCIHPTTFRFENSETPHSIPQLLPLCSFDITRDERSLLLVSLSRHGDDVKLRDFLNRSNYLS